MRILYSHRILSRDGQGVHIEELVEAFRRAGHEVLIVGPSRYNVTEFGGESRPVATARRTLPRALVELAELAYNFPALLRLHRSCKRFAPDLVYERYNLYYVGGMLLTRWLRLPYYLEINAPLAEERARYGGLGLARLARVLERMVWRSADRVFVVTGVLGEMAAAAGVARQRIAVLHNGVNLKNFSAEPDGPRPEGVVTIGFVGFVHEWHGLDTVIAGLAAMREQGSVRLIVAGEGPIRASLEQQAQALGVAALVQFIGLQQRAAIPGLLRRFDIAVQPRAVRYASPLKLFEYMACGRAIVAPDQPNIREILTHEETALLFDPDDPAAMWEAIRRLAADAQLRERLGRAARAALEARDYTWDGNAAKVTAGAAKDPARCGVAGTGAVRFPSG